MGKESRQSPSDYGETQAHHVSISPQEDRSGTAGTVGEVQSGEEVVFLDRDRSLASSSTRSARRYNPIRPAEQRYVQEHGSQAYQQLLRRLFDELFPPD
jgi:hypothetical protein